MTDEQRSESDGTPEPEIIYLNMEDVLGLYSGIFGCTLRQAEDQLRSSETLESALTRPQFYAHYEDADIAKQAAVLTHGIAETQPFIEGNKRTAAIAMLTFLRVNGFGLTASTSERFDWMVRLSEGESPEELAERIRAALVPLTE